MPHHALGHARRAAGIDEELIFGRAHYAERRSVAFLRECLVRDRKRRDLRSLANFHKGVNFLEPILELDDTVAEFRTVDDHFAIGIVEDVRSEEHTSAPVTNAQLVCRLLLDKK